MDRPRDCHTKWNKSGREKEIPYISLYEESKKKWYKWTYLENRLTDLEEELTVSREEGWEWWMYREFEMDMYTLLYIKRITNKDLLYSTGNSAEYYAAAWMGGELEGEWIHVHVWLSCFAVHLKLSQPCLSAILQYKIKSLKKRREREKKKRTKESSL